MADRVYFASIPPQPPSVSPDRGFLAYAFRPDRFEPGNSAGLAISDTVNSDRVLSTDDEDYEPAWSPDGQYLAFQSDTRRQPVGPPFELFYLLEVASGDVRPVEIDRLIGEGPPNRVQWFPDGERVLFSRFLAGIWTVDVDGGNLVQIHSGKAGWVKLSPIGDLVAFNADQTLFVINADGTELRALHHVADRIEHSAWSPDGSRLAFVADDGGDGGKHLYIVGADGTGLRNLTEDEFDYSTPAWSPDGSRLAFCDGPRGWLDDQGKSRNGQLRLPRLARLGTARAQASFPENRLGGTQGDRREIPNGGRYGRQSVD